MNSTSITIPSGSTLSGLAESNGVSVNDIVNANKSNTAALPNPGNPNLIVAGQSLNIPKASVIQTTTDQRDQTASRSANLNGMVSNMGANNGIDGTSTGTGTPTPVSSIKTAGQSIVDGNGNSGTAKYDPITGKPLPGTSDTSNSEDDPFLTQINSQISGLNSDAKDQITTVNSNLDRIKANTDANTASMIEALQGIYASRISSTESSFDRLSASKAESGYRNGLTRYANDQEGGLLTTVEVNKQAAVAKLQADLQAAISKAQQAQTEGDTKAFNDAYDHIDNINKEMKSQVADLYKTAVDKQNADLKASQQAQTESAATLKNTLAVSSKIAPGVAAQLSNFKTDEEKANFISETAASEGIDPNVLLGDVTGALSKNEKDALSIENIKSEIAKRDSTGSGSGSGSKATGGGKDGGYTYTGKDIDTYNSLLNKGGTDSEGNTFAGRGTDDTFVDPGAYLAVYKDWIANNGTVKGFLKNFPVTNVNPDSYSELPTGLQPKAKTTSTSNLPK